MLKNMKVITGLIIAFLIFCALQTVTGALFYSSVNNDRHNFQRSSLLNMQQDKLGDGITTLIKTRITVTRVAIRFLKNQHDAAATAAIEKLLASADTSLENAENTLRIWKALPAIAGQNQQLAAQIEKDYRQMHDVLKTSVAYLRQNDYASYGNLDAQQAQDALEQTYSRWHDENVQSLQDGLAENQRSFQQMQWTLLIILVVMVAVVLIVWQWLERLLLRPLSRIMQHIRDIASGNLTHRITWNGRNDMGQLAAGLHDMQQSLVNTVSTVRNSTDSIYTGAGEISAGNNDLSSRTEQQAASLEETAASMEQLTATVKQNTDNARQAAQLAKSASDTAVRGGKVVDNVIKTMHDIADSSHQIAHITAVIDSIAFQTNILALNAAVEAARAGEQGRGFAVVAGEVRTLASRSAQAAKEIKTLIENSVSRVNTGSAQVSEAGETMQEIVTAVTHVTDIMGEIASASDEQSNGIEQVNLAIAQMDSVTQQNAALVEEAAAAAASLEEQAAQLRLAVATFRLHEADASQMLPDVPLQQLPSPLPAI